MKYTYIQFIRFSLIALVSALIDFGLLTLLVEVYAVHYLIATGLAFIVANIFNYFNSMRFVFQSRFKDSERGKEVSVFFGIAFLGFLLNQSLMVVFTSVFQFYYIFSKVVAAVVIMVFNFFAKKRWLEQKGD